MPVPIFDPRKSTGPSIRDSARFRDPAKSHSSTRSKPVTRSPGHQAVRFIAGADPSRCRGIHSVGASSKPNSQSATSSPPSKCVSARVIPRRNLQPSRTTGLQNRAARASTCSWKTQSMRISGLGIFQALRFTLSGNGTRRSHTGFPPASAACKRRSHPAEGSAAPGRSASTEPSTDSNTSSDGDSSGGLARSASVNHCHPGSPKRRANSRTNRIRQYARLVLCSSHRRCPLRRYRVVRPVLLVRGRHPHLG